MLFEYGDVQYDESTHYIDTFRLLERFVMYHIVAFTAKSCRHFSRGFVVDKNRFDPKAFVCDPGYSETWLSSSRKRLYVAFQLQITK
ncbi:MAG: hypothetical protein WCR04_12370 [Fibrobacteraceae bacterium]